MGEMPDAVHDTAVHEAAFWEADRDARVRCVLCPHDCRIPDGAKGACGVRLNRHGTLYTVAYDRVVARHVEPIEKKPLFHYLPGTPAFSIATAGCNIECKFCQNWQISQFRPEQVESVEVPPDRLVSLCRSGKSPTIAYTYSEPVIFYEYMHDTAALARQHGVGQVLIPDNGTVVELRSRGLSVVGRVPTGQLVVEGKGVGDARRTVLRDRLALAQTGLVVAVITMDPISIDAIISTG